MSCRRVTVYYLRELTSQSYYSSLCQYSVIHHHLYMDFYQRPHQENNNVNDLLPHNKNILVDYRLLHVLDCVMPTGLTE